MSLRINNAQNFAGKKYMVTDDVDNVIKSIQLNEITSGALGNNWSLTYKEAEGGKNPNTEVVDLAPIKGYVDNAIKGVTSAAISVKGVEGNAVTVVKGVPNDTEHTISLKLADDTLSQSAAGLKSTLKIVKKKTNSGYAASYHLVDGNGAAVADSVDIDIVKDQFLKSASIVWSIEDGAAPTETPLDHKDETHVYPFLKLEMWVNTDGDASLNEGDKATVIYIPVSSLFHDYNGSTGDEINVVVDAKSNVISANVAKISGSKITDKTIERAKVSSTFEETLKKADTAIQAGDATRLEYKNNGAANVSGALDDLYGKVGTETVAAQITSAIAKLDGTDSAEGGKYVTHVTEVDGVASSVKATIPVASAKYDSADGTVKTVDGEGTETAVVNLTPIKTAVEQAVQLVAQDSVSMNQESKETPATSAKVQGRVLAVYNAEGEQLYPEIKFNGDDGTSTIKADFGEIKKETWTVLHTANITLNLADMVPQAPTI